MSGSERTFGRGEWVTAHLSSRVRGEVLEREDAIGVPRLKIRAEDGREFWCFEMACTPAPAPGGEP